MRKFYLLVVRNPKKIIIFFSVFAVVGAVLQNFVAVNYNINDYLPKDSASTVSLTLMESEFDGGIPNARVMVSDVTVPEALEYKEKLEAVDGVTAVTWLDDAIDIRVPLAIQDSQTIETYYKDGTALFSVTVEKEKQLDAVNDIREIIGDENEMSGSAVSTALATTNTVSEIQKIAVIAVLFVLFVLLLTTNSWIDPFVILIGLGIAILINKGSNLIFGEISFISNAAGTILQLAVSLDYSVFLMHRYTECLKSNPDPENAMTDAVCKSVTSILSSGLTTVIGFLALVFMRFGIGADLGLVLAKGVAISLITVFIFMPALILTAHKFMLRTTHRSFLPDFRGFGKFVRRAMLPCVCLFVIIAVPSYTASNANNYYYGSAHLYGTDTQLGQDIEKIEQVFGKSDTYVLMVPRNDIATEKRLSDELHTLPEVTSIISYVDMAGAEIPPEYLDESALSQLMSDSYSRMVITVDADYEGDNTFALVEEIRAIAQKYYPSEYYLAGEGVSTYDLMDTVTSDMVKVNLIAIGAVFLVLLFMMRSVALPIILVLSIEAAIWTNLAFPYFMDDNVFYLAYLIISSVQLGATVDYAILLTDRYREFRNSFSKKEAITETLSAVTVSILTSGSVLAVVGFLLGFMSSHRLLAQLGIFIGRGALCSLGIVLFVLPGLLYIFDRIIILPKEPKQKQRFKKRKQIKNWRKQKMEPETNMKKLFKGKPLVRRRILSAALAAALLLGMTVPVSAAEPNTPKQEVVYGNLNADGTAAEIYVVNIFDLDEAGQIIDYGDYQSLRNMTTTDKINYENGAVTVEASAGKLYYEGLLESTALPWNISIRYYMDGVEYPADKIAGMSGALKITVDITENTSCAGDFFDGYALQATVTLNSYLCGNISASGATVANVGSDKQLTYTILPGKGANIEITADVADFEMDAIAINGIPLNLNIEIDDEELMEQITDLSEAIEELDDGAGNLYDGVAELRDSAETDLRDGVSELQSGAYELYNGTADLKDGGTSLQSGAADLQNGAVSLDGGIESLNDGIGRIQSALDSLNAQSGTLTDGSSEFKASLTQLALALDGVSVTSEDLSELTAASSSIKTGIDDLVSGISELRQNVSFAAYKALMSRNGLDVDALKANNEAAVSSLGTLIENLRSQIAVLQETGQDTSALESQIEQLSNIILLLQANNASISGTESYLTAVSQNLATLLSGATALQTNYDAFDSEIGDLADTLGGLEYQMSSLASAVNALVSAYEELDSGITDYTTAVAQIVVGYSQISDGAAQLLTGSGSLVSGTKSLYSGTSELLSGIAEIYDGTGSLYDGTGELNEGVAGLLAGISELYDGAGELKDGTSALREETQGMDTKISDKIDELLESVTGDDVEITSFVSEKNTNIDSVQFVLQTPAIELAEDEIAAIEEPAPLTFRQKLLKLFGLYD